MASTNVIGDLKTVYNNGPSTVTQANCIAAAGEIMDYPGLNESAKHQAGEAEEMLVALVGNTDAGTDGTNKTLLQGIEAALTGTGGPSSHVITDITTVITNGPSTVTTANAIAPAGEIMDYPGLCRLVKLKFQQCYEQVLAMYNNTDASTDATNRALLLGVTQTLS